MRGPIRLTLCSDQESYNDGQADASLHIDLRSWMRWGYGTETQPPSLSRSLTANQANGPVQHVVASLAQTG